MIDLWFGMKSKMKTIHLSDEDIRALAENIRVAFNEGYAFWPSESVMRQLGFEEGSYLWEDFTRDTSEPSLPASRVPDQD